jgi:peptidoglycan/LPS O-acetylase OafA/YrhL
MEMMYANKYSLFPTHLRIDSLLFGVLISYYHHFKLEAIQTFVRKNKIPITIGSIAFLLPSAFLGVSHYFMHTVGLTLLYLGYAGILVLFLYCNPIKPIENNKVIIALSYIGVYSYSIYIWHIPIRQTLLWLITKQYLISSQFHLFCMYIGISLVFGVLMSLLVETPFLRLRDKLFPSRSRSLKSKNEKPGFREKPVSE